MGEIAGSYSTVVLMFGFAVVATAPALLISRMIAPRTGGNPVKFLPMECGQVPSGAGRTHFMMQYYAYILMFVIFDVMAIFLYAWGGAVLNLPKAATLPILAFLAIMFAAMSFALYQSKRRNIW
ncbi:MAG: NADH-ubiquinone oxidoreductase subunit A [Cenarchaeum symbiont of Oopsacas minuta]|nr:NADH-ubiquinone oxidoreductase subunit A [Cenarchaeum symbiont of Oopsacas minuta]